MTVPWAIYSSCKPIIRFQWNSIHAVFAIFFKMVSALPVNNWMFAMWSDFMIKWTIYTLRQINNCMRWTTHTEMFQFSNLQSLINIFDDWIIQIHVRYRDAFSKENRKTKWSIKWTYHNIHNIKYVVEKFHRKSFMWIKVNYRLLYLNISSGFGYFVFNEH